MNGKNEDDWKTTGASTNTGQNSFIEAVFPTPTKITGITLSNLHYGGFANYVNQSFQFQYFDETKK